MYLCVLMILNSSTGMVVKSEKEQLEKELNDIWRKSYVDEFFNPIESNDVLPNLGKN